MRVRFTPRARSDLQSIIKYLSDRSPQGMRNVRRALEVTIQLIGQYQDCGRLDGEQTVRVLPVGRYPHLVYWTVVGDEVWIVHIRDGRRKPWRGT